MKCKRYYFIIQLSYVDVSSKLEGNVQNYGLDEYRLKKGTN